MFPMKTQINLRFIKKIKGLIYFLFFNILGILIIYSGYNPNAEVSSVIGYMADNYHAYILGLSFMLAGASSLYVGNKGFTWSLFIFAPMFIYTTISIFAYLNNVIDLLSVVMNLLICSLNMYDVLENEINQNGYL